MPDGGVDTTEQAPGRAPAGWYPVPDGGQRFWDGEQWTNDIAPTAGGVILEAEEPLVREAGFYTDPERKGVRFWDGVAWAPRSPFDFRDRPLPPLKSEPTPLIFVALLAALGGAIVGLLWWLLAEHQLVSDYSDDAWVLLLCLVVLPTVAGAIAIAIAHESTVWRNGLYALGGAVVVITALSGLVVTSLPGHYDSLEEISLAISVLMTPGAYPILGSEWLWCGVVAWTLTGIVVTVSGRGPEIRVPAVIGGTIAGSVAGVAIVYPEAWIDGLDGYARYGAPALGLVLIALGATLGDRLTKH